MWELYWLTRVDFIIAIATMLLFASMVIFISIIIGWTQEAEIPDKVKYLRKCSCIVGAISLITIFLIPTKEDLLLIYGLGPTIDYIQDNKKVQELPDKCVEALSKWVDSLDNKE